MASLYITEFVALPKDGPYDASQPMPVGALPPVAEQKVTFTTSTQSAAFNAATRYVRVISDAACHIAAGANPTATTSNMRLIADAPEYFGVVAGQKLAAIAA